MLSVNFLGHQLSAKGLQPLEKHKEAVNRFPVPTNTPEIRSFEGLVRFNEHFVGANLRDFRGERTTNCFPKSREMLNFSTSVDSPRLFKAFRVDY